MHNLRILVGVIDGDDTIVDVAGVDIPVAHGDCVSAYNVTHNARSKMSAVCVEMIKKY